MNQDKLLERLVEDGIVDRVDLAMLLSDARHRDMSVERLLVEEAMADENRVLKAMSEVYDIPLVHLSGECLDQQTARQLPEALLKTYDVYPVLPEEGGEEGTVYLAMADPFDVNAEDAVRYLTGKRVERVLSPRSEIEAARSGKLGTDTAGFQMILDKIPQDHELEYVHAALEQSDDDEPENTGPVIMLVNSLVSDAIRLGASDIHFEPLRTTVRVRYRMDGLLRTMVELPKRVQNACTARFKLISGIDISESRKPQDGRSRARTRGKEIDLRVSTIPTFYGEKVVVRLLDQSGTFVDLPKLGLSPPDFATMSSLLKSSHGMILITGPTGSGKTSTLYAALKTLNREQRNIVTVEDPVEYQLEGVNQVQVNPKAGVTFASALRSILRQDPDIVMVGEVRDLETAEIAVQAAQTGHLVFSTLHTNDAPSTLTRLVLMGLEPYMVTTSLLCVVAQRLVRKLCPHCRRQGEPDAELLELLSQAAEHVPAPRVVWHAQGCAECEGTGYKGRTGLFELLTVTDAIREVMLAEGLAEEKLWNLARREGMRTLLEDGCQKVVEGITSLEEMMRVVTIKREGSSRSSEIPTTAVTSRAPVADRRPAGKTTVAQIMSPVTLTLTPEMELSELVQSLVENEVSGAPVVDGDNRLLGVVSFTDVALTGKFWESRNGPPTARQLMSPRALTLSPEQPVEAAVDLFRRYKVHRLVVTRDDRPVGMVTPLDLWQVMELAGAPS